MEEEKEILESSGDTKSNVAKTCFVIMPISNNPSYEDGHFTRVYEHLIKPACKIAGYKTFRADDDVKTDHITISILKQIVEADMAICDMSSRNPNVFYELGMRQAFNKKTVLIRDNSTTIPFDIQDLRTYEYDKNLRVDNITKSVEEIAKIIKETGEMNPEEVNSMVDLIGISTAKVKKGMEVSPEMSYIINEIRGLSSAVKELRKETRRANSSLIYPNQMIDLDDSLPGLNSHFKVEGVPYSSWVRTNVD